MKYVSFIQHQATITLINICFSSHFFLHVSGVVFMFLFPILQCTCFYLAIGDNPKSLKLGIVNEEVSNLQECYNSSMVMPYINSDDSRSCNLTKVSCRYLKDIPPEYAIQVDQFFF